MNHSGFQDRVQNLCLYGLMKLTPGTKEDPVPWTPNMQPEEGKYYKEEELLAECVEDPGQPLYNKLAELCPGRYFTVVE